MFALLTVFACAGSGDSGESLSEEVGPATIAFIDPVNGGTVITGDVTFSVDVANFTLEDPAKHNDDQPIGYIQLTLDDADAGIAFDRHFDLTLEGGDHTLLAALMFEDGDELDPPVSASVTFTAAMAQ